MKHQDQYARVGVLFSGPYITRLIIGIGVMDAIRGAEKIIISSPLGLETMRLMDMIRRYRDGVNVINMPPLEPVEGQRDATEGLQPAL